MNVSALIHQLQSHAPGDAPVSIESNGTRMAVTAVQLTSDGGAMIVSRGSQVTQNALEEYRAQRESAAAEPAADAADPAATADAPPAGAPA